ncbi:flagellar brake protein [Janthinobacterium fluminis]|uniref:PilZ domain-containing protein n=1 Tax=Janthinobacterium fluminis TaxID=2987524 RepID=A0ABT5K508_9BURK|nr:PilZ domain-containing protein [Janthinobacterium fluminis]MDC8759959.1 PilZ domain-containing protein [Janthinobacterium fluminis]
MNDPIPNPLRKGPPSLAEATDPIPPGAKPHHMSDPWDIGEALARLAEGGDAVTIYPADGVAPVMARILSVDEELPHFVVELNDGSFLPPGSATFVAWVHSAKLQFTLSSGWVAQDGQPTLLPADFPAECLVLERRESARLEAPLGVYHVAAFVLEGRPYELQLYDFSIGGVGMRAHPRDTVGLYVGRKLSRVRLELGPEKVMIADLEIRLSRSFRSFLLGEQVQIGCRFLNLSPALQEELKQLLAGMSSGRKRGA